MLLQVILEELTSGSKLISALLTVIAGLLVYIWQDNKKNSEQKHRDIVGLIDAVKEEQDDIKKKQMAHDFQIYALNVAINLVQGKPYNYDNTKVPEK